MRSHPAAESSISASGLAASWSTTRLGTSRLSRSRRRVHIALTADRGHRGRHFRVAYDEGVLWQASYFGLADTTRRSNVAHMGPGQDAPGFQFHYRSSPRRIAWAHRPGVSVTEATLGNYQVGKDGKGVVTYAVRVSRRDRTMATALSDGFVMAVWADDHEAWFATSNGLSRPLLFACRPGGAHIEPKVHP